MAWMGADYRATSTLDTRNRFSPGEISMNRRTMEYVMGLDSTRVNRMQHHLLTILAFYHQQSRETYWPSHKTLAIKCHIGEGEGTKNDERQIRRLIEQVEAAGILEFTPRAGRGNCGSYRFPELENRTNEAQNRTVQSSFSEIKQDIKQDNWRPVRSIEVNLTKPLQDQSQNLTLPNPPSCEGGNSQTLTSRQIKTLAARIASLTADAKSETSRQKNPDPDCEKCNGVGKYSSTAHTSIVCWCCWEEIPAPSDEELMEEACRQLMYPIVAARNAMVACGRLPAERKPPESISA
jgi:hypothetical protein